MGKFIRTVMLCALVVGLRAAEPAWTTDFAAAKAQAQKENKAMLLDFTGSDWCGYCIKLKKAVFDKPEFQDYAAKKLVLVEVDFPQQKQQSKEVKEQNDKLNSQFKVGGYPTIVILDPNGKELGRLEGYSGESPSAYMSKLDKFVGKVKSTASK